MRFMVIVKADRATEAGVLPTANDLEVMGAFNEQLIKAGALVDANGLQASSKGARITRRDGRIAVTDGPFAESKELIAGYWIIEAKSKDEAVEWCKRVPFDHLPHDGREPELELRQIFEIGDFPDVPAGVAEQEKALKK